MAKKTWTEWWVEYDFIDTPYGKRANWIRTFKTEAEAIAFADSVDGSHLFAVNCTKV